MESINASDLKARCLAIRALGSSKLARNLQPDLIRPALVVARYFAPEQHAIETLQVRWDTAAREVEEFIERDQGLFTHQSAEVQGILPSILWHSTDSVCQIRAAIEDSTDTVC